MANSSLLPQEVCSVIAHEALGIPNDDFSLLFFQYHLGCSVGQTLHIASACKDLCSCKCAHQAVYAITFFNVVNLPAARGLFHQDAFVLNESEGEKHFAILC